MVVPKRSYAGVSCCPTLVDILALIDPCPSLRLGSRLSQLLKESSELNCGNANSVDKQGAASSSDCDLAAHCVAEHRASVGQKVLSTEQ